MAYCMQCGAKLKDGARFCENCGTRVEQPRSPAPARPAPGAAANRDPVRTPAATDAAPVNRNPYSARTGTGSSPENRNPYSVRPSSAPVQASPAPREEAPARKRHPFRTFLAIVLILALLITGFGYPGFLLDLFAGGRRSSGSGPQGGTSGGVAGIFGGASESSAPGGNSRAFSIRPVTGMTISAEKNAMDRDRSFSVHELEESDPRLQELDGLCSAAGAYLIGACEIDAGLGDDEHLPGKYRTELNLEEIGLDASLHEYVHAYRMDSQGNIDEYSTVLDGCTLSYESSQNSVAFWVVIIPILIGGSIPVYNKYKDLHASERYMENSAKEVFSMDFKADGGDFSIIWQVDDINPMTLAELNQIEKNSDYEVRQRFPRKEDEEYLDWKKRIAPAVLDSLLENDRYQELASGLAFPSSIESLKEIIREAFSYLSKEQKVKMPSYRVRFYVINQLIMGSKQGVANTGTFLGKHNYYIDLNSESMNDRAGFKKEDRDNMLLTICHELFHLCQMEYPNENLVVDEATAVLLERDAYAHFKSKGIVGDIPESSFCPNTFYEDLIYGINGAPSDNDSLQNLGYTLSGFLDYCRTVKKKDVSATDVRAGFDGSFVSTIKKVYGMEDETLSLFFRKYCCSLSDEFMARRTSASETDTAAFSPVVEIEPGGETELRLSGTEYSATIREFKTPDYRESALVFTMPKGCLDEGATGFRAVPAGMDGLTETEKGFFVPDGRGSHYLLEILDGYVSEISDPTYRITVMGTPLSPTAAVEDEILHVTLPKASKGMLSGSLDGYRVRITCSDGQVTEIPVLTEDCPGGVHEDIYGLVSEKTANADVTAQTFKVTVAEYVTSLDGGECCGPESLEADAANNDAAGWALEAVIYGDHYTGDAAASLSVNGNAFSASKEANSFSGTVPYQILQPSDLDFSVTATDTATGILGNCQVAMSVKDFPDVMQFSTGKPNDSIIGNCRVSGSEYYDLITRCESRYLFLQIGSYFVFVYRHLAPGEQPSAAPDVSYSNYPISDAWDRYRSLM